MADATLSDLLEELQNIRDAINALGQQGGGGGGAAGRGPTGGAGSAGGALASFKGYANAAASGISAGVDIADQAGILAGIRAKNLGGSNAAAIGSVAGRVTDAASQSTLGRALLAKTSLVSDRAQSAEGAVSSFAETAALGGAELSDDALNEALRRQKGIAGIRQATKLRVQNLSTAQDTQERAKALSGDVGALVKMGENAVGLATDFDKLREAVARLYGDLISAVNGNPRGDR